MVVGIGCRLGGLGKGTDGNREDVKAGITSTCSFAAADPESGALVPRYDGKGALNGGVA